MVAGAGRIAGGDLAPLLRIPRLCLRHGFDWPWAPLAVGAAMGLMAVRPGGLGALLDLRLGAVLSFLAFFPPLIWLTLAVGVEACREDLVGRLHPGAAARWRGRVAGLRDGLPLLALQLAWLAPTMIGAAFRVGGDLLVAASYLGLFYAGFSSFFLLAVRRLEGSSVRGAFLLGHARALRALALAPVDALAHLQVVFWRRGSGLLDPSEATVAAHALGTVGVMLCGAALGGLAWPGHAGFWWGGASWPGDVVFAALASFGFTLGAQAGATLTAYEVAALLAAEQGLLRGGGWSALSLEGKPVPPRLAGGTDAVRTRP